MKNKDELRQETTKVSPITEDENGDLIIAKPAYTAVKKGFCERQPKKKDPYINDNNGKGKRILCGGRCVTGPKRGRWIPLGVALFIMTGIAVNAYLVIEEIVQPKFGYAALIVFSISFLSSVTVLVL